MPSCQTYLEPSLRSSNDRVALTPLAGNLFPDWEYIFGIMRAYPLPTVYAQTFHPSGTSVK